MATTSRSLEIHPGPPRRVEGAQALEPSSATFPSALAESWVRRPAGTQNSASTWYAGIRISGLTLCTTSPALTYHWEAWSLTSHSPIHCNSGKSLLSCVTHNTERELATCQWGQRARQETRENQDPFAPFITTCSCKNSYSASHGLVSSIPSEGHAFMT